MDIYMGNPDYRIVYRWSSSGYGYSSGRASMSHTIGPWVAQKRQNRMIEIHHSMPNVKGAITLSLCRVQSRDSWVEEAEANARLIAAAPELLAALQMAIQAMRAPLDGWKGDIERSALDVANAAVAKATGENP
jgi:hypothetical protein